MALFEKKEPHLLIIRFSAMGDVAMMVPVVKALRADNPQLKITILTRAFFQPFFRDIENIGFLTPDFKGRHKGIAGMIRLYRDICACGVTHVADLHDVIRTKELRLLLRLFGKRVSVIDKGRADKRALTRKFRKFMVQLKPTVQRYREAILRLRFRFREPIPVQRMELPIPQAMLSAAGEKKGRWIGVAPFAQHKGKIYPTQLSDELISLLAAEYERVFVFGGGPYEREFAECMEERHSGVISVIGKIRLSEELDLIANLDLMVSMDSSAMHMASLVGTPVVSVWGATHPYAGFYGFGQDPEGAVQLDMSCRPCSVYGNKQCLYGDYRCLSQIPPQMIVDRVRMMLDRKG